jgi:zinc protease
VAAVGTTFGALPARAPKANEPPGARDIRYPSKPASLRFTHDGQADQAASYVSWAAPDFYSNPKRARTVSLMSEIMEVRMVDEFREAQGATYSPSAGSGASDKIPGYGFVQAQAETRPELVEGFYKTVDKIVTELKTGAFTDDALTRARTPLIDRAETDRLSNNFWVGAIEDAQSEPGALDSIRTQIDDLKAITKAEIAAAANQYLTPARRIEIRVLPKTVAADSIKSGAKSSKQLVGETVGH